MSNVERIAYTLATLENLLEGMSDCERKWFERRGVLPRDLNSLRLNAKVVSSAYFIIPDDPRTTDELTGGGYPDATKSPPNDG